MADPLRDAMGGLNVKAAGLTTVTFSDKWPVISSAMWRGRRKTASSIEVDYQFCPRRLNFEPPYRFNFELGAEANF